MEPNYTHSWLLSGLPFLEKLHDDLELSGSALSRDSNQNRVLGPIIL